MAKSYKITFYSKFDTDTFQLAPYLLDKQMTLEGLPPDPQTKIMIARDRIVFEDFEKYIIEHEMEENALGRISDSIFSKYIHKEYIHSYQSEKYKTLLLSGKKRYVLDFCKKTKVMDHIKIQTIKLDMGVLLAKLPHVKGVWFHFDNGLIRASALMGVNLESTTDFKRFSEEGDISTLSFHYEYGSLKHPIMVTDDGTIVLYTSFKQISAELEIVIDIYNNLLFDLYKKVD